MRVLLFVSSNCPHCPRAEDVVKRLIPHYYNHGLSFAKIRVKSEEGKRLSSEYRIMGTPTILMLDDKGNELKRIVGVPSEENFKNTIEKTLGIKKSFIDRIFGWDR